MPKNLKIPKKVAGVKLPKQVRKRAKKAIKMGASEVVREIASAAIGAGAGRAAGTRPGGAEHRVRARIHVDGNKIGEAIRAAAIDGLQRFLEGMEEGLRAVKERDAADKEARKAPSRRTAKRGSRAPRGA